MDRATEIPSVLCEVLDDKTRFLDINMHRVVPLTRLGKHHVVSICFSIYLLYNVRGFLVYQIYKMEEFAYCELIAVS